MQVEDMLNYAVLYGLAKRLHTQTLSVGNIYQTLADGLGEVMHVAHAAVLVLDGKRLVRVHVLGAMMAEGISAQLWHQLYQKGLAQTISEADDWLMLKESSDPRMPNLPQQPYIPQIGSLLGAALRLDGETLAVMVAVHPRPQFFDAERQAALRELIELGQGALRHAYASLKDEAQRARELAETERLRTDLSAMIYHDLRAPLQNILISTTKLGSLLQNHENSAVRRMLNAGNHSTKRLQRLVDSLLDIQRLEAGRSILNRSECDLHDLLSEAVALVQPLAQEASQTILLDTAHDLPRLRIDGDMVLRVVVNLLENALKYAPDGGLIEVIAYLREHQVHIIVRDNGPGIPLALRGSIFDKFSRVRYENAPKGIGLGLAFCKLATEAHGGSIWVEGEEGKGSDFIFSLPLDEQSTVHSLQSNVASAS